MTKAGGRRDPRLPLREQQSRKGVGDEAAHLVSSLFPNLRCLPLPSEGRVQKSQGGAILGQEAAPQQQNGRKWMEGTDKKQPATEFLAQLSNFHLAPNNLRVLFKRDDLSCFEKM